MVQQRTKRFPRKPAIPKTEAPVLHCSENEWAEIAAEAVNWLRAGHHAVQITIERQPPSVAHEPATRAFYIRERMKNIALRGEKFRFEKSEMDDTGSLLLTITRPHT